MKVKLNATEKASLFQQPPSTKGRGGYQSLLVGLQERVDDHDAIDLTAKDLERIPRYAFSYGNGGWEDQLTTIFSRHLGSGLSQR
jgi:hypothetical protein